MLGLVAASLTCQPATGEQPATSGSFGSQLTTTTVTSSEDPSMSGQAVTFSASVSSAAGPASGSVVFDVADAEGGPVTCTQGNTDTQALNASGVATCTTPALTSADSPYSVKATYAGTLGDQGSSGQLTPPQTVSLASSSTAVTSSQNTATSSQGVVFTATVTGTGTPNEPPTGTVIFTVMGSDATKYTCDEGAAPATPLPLSGDSTTCSFTPGQLPPANSPFTVSAVYGGDTNNAPSPPSASITETVSAG